MNDDVTLSYYNVFFVIIYYAISIFVLIVLFKLRGYVRGYIREVFFTVIVVVVSTAQYSICVNGGVLVYILPHYFSIYDYDSIKYGAWVFVFLYPCLLIMDKPYSEERKSRNNGEENE
ncbi:hypothetical protein TI10_15675 [Photorhabdus luminescens subsp. luminescens]|uniref:Uncharacterized protein n=1 Tax=Photorhabdus luminescens TaxID=29488 RepID=A0A1G5RD79_PHOLU|nr:hypothetical protein [Photorhabdus luminescens]KMW72391.1 hypothetical protein TI10_15675 [Photorhabdus luminescens subsp. luminescens]SCZ71361.1 hypothetical protein SAMN02982990_03709 [Photorhabdus luminescens]